MTDPVLIPDDGAEHACVCGVVYSADDGWGWMVSEPRVVDDEGRSVLWCGCGRELAAVPADPVVIRDDGIEHPCVCGAAGFSAWPGLDGEPDMIVVDARGDRVSVCGCCGRTLEAVR